MRRRGEDPLRNGEEGALSVVLFQVCIRFVFQSIMFGAACTKGVPDPKKGRRGERKRGMTSVEGKGHGGRGYLSEIVISCYYTAHANYRGEIREDRYR